ncbi:MAG: phage integrase, partial [Sulfurovum sp.]
MAIRHKTKFNNVIYMDSTTSGNPDKTYYIRYRENGKQREIKVGKFSEGIRENYCNQKLIETLNAIRLGEQPPIISSSHKKHFITFDEVVTKYFDLRELHNKTNHQARSKYKSQLKDYIGHKDINSITKDDIIQIQTKMAETRAPKTVNQYVQFIRSVYKYTIEEEIFTGTNPAKGITEQKIDNKRERFLSVNEIKKLLSYLREESE